MKSIPTKAAALQYIPLYILVVVFLSVSVIGCSSSSSLLDSATAILEGMNSDKPLTESEVGLGIKDALIQGITNGATELAKENGYASRPAIRIPFPEDAKFIEDRLRSLGLNKEMDRVVSSLNNAAEDAALKAIPVFTSAIKKMTIQDAFSILRGDSVAATNYLRSATSTELTSLFAEPIAKSLDKVQATKYWSDVIGTYNQIPFIKKVDPDLNAYVAQKAIDGLFVMVAKEEQAIRENPAARTTDLLRRVFGSAK
jgi:hypothetical protein